MIQISKQIKSILFLLIILSVIILSGIVYVDMKQQQKTTHSELTFEKIFTLSELATLQYNYKDVAALKEPKQIAGMNLPFTEKSVVLMYTGNIKAGVDFGEIKLDIGNNNEVNIKLPHSIILSNSINEEELKVYDERSGLFNKLTIQNVFDLLSQEKDKIEREVVEKGFLVESDEQATKVIEKWLNDLGYENVNIIFIDAE